MVKRISAIGVMALLLFSCEKEIEFKGKSSDPMLVLNCINESDSTFKVELQRSRFFMESTNGNFAITTGAVVTLTNVTTGQVYTSSTPGPDGVYSMGVASVPGNEYSIQVTHPDYETISGKTRIPIATPILSADTSSYIKEGMAHMKANVKWNDPAGEDFYVMKMAVYDEDQDWDIFPELQLASFDLALDSWSSSDLGDENFTNALFFTDELFDGSQKTMEIRFPDLYLSQQNHYKVILFRVNKETYKYLLSAEKASYGDDPFSEPSKVFTNIEKGFGIFGGVARAVFVI